MSLGLDPENELVLQWRWLPAAPLPITQSLPERLYEDELLFRHQDVGAAQAEAFRYGFPQLAKQTPDARFYRLIQIFNTPLLNMSSRDAGRSEYAYWHGKMQPMHAEHRWAHFWYYEDQTDADFIVIEYSFTGSLKLHSQLKPKTTLKKRYDAICARVGLGM